MTLSSGSEQTLPCPQCRQRNPVMLWERIVLEEKPELRDALFNGELNVYQCPACGETAYVAAPLLYHDLGKNYAVQYLPAQMLENGSVAELFGRDGLPRGSAPGGLVPHVVFDPAELLRYIAFRELLEHAAVHGESAVATPPRKSSLIITD